MIRTLLGTVAFGSLLLLGGCASTALSPESAGWLQAEPYCHGTDDCTLKWGRALAWTQSHIRYRLMSANDFLISTAGPEKNSPVPAASITKTALDYDQYRISIRIGCANMFGCVPSLQVMMASFNSYVMTGADIPEYKG